MKLNSKVQTNHKRQHKPIVSTNQTFSIPSAFNGEKLVPSCCYFKAQREIFIQEHSADSAGIPFTEWHLLPPACHFSLKK